MVGAVGPSRRRGDERAHRRSDALRHSLGARRTAAPAIAAGGHYRHREGVAGIEKRTRL